MESKKRSGLRVLAAALVAACSNGRDERAEPRILSSALTIDGPPVAVATVDAASLDAALSSGYVALSLDDQTVELGSALVTFGNDTAVITLYDHPVNCKTREFPDQLERGTRVEIEVPPGPHASYYIGAPFGAEVDIEPPSRRRGAPLTTVPIDRASAIVTLEPSTLKTGTSMHGTVDAHMADALGTATVTGSFDAEVCSDLPANAKEEEAVLPDKAPSGPVHGMLGGKRIAPRTVLAIVHGRAADRAEGIRIARGLASGSLHEIELLSFYAEPDVPCPVGRLDADPDRSPLFVVHPGGTGDDHPIRGAVQPARIDVRVSDWWWGWVRFDALAWKAGDQVRGSLWAQSTAITVPDAKGHVGGDFVATVCVVDP